MRGGWPWRRSRVRIPAPRGTGRHVFISYSRRDARYVRRLIRHLTGAGVVVWFDENLRPGERWTAGLEERIDTAAAVLVVWSAHAARSEWVDQEITRAKQTGRPILPILLDGTPLPLAINTVQGTDAAGARMPAEPFIAALRAAAGGSLPRSATAPDHGWYVEREYGELVVPVLAEVDQALEAVGETSLLVVDDCVRLYRTRGPADWADGIAVRVTAEPAQALVSGVTGDVAARLVAEAALDAAAAEYLTGRSDPDPAQQFWAKVSLRRIIFDNDQIPGSELELRVGSMSYWIEQDINRRFVGSTDEALNALWRHGLAAMFGPTRPPDGFELSMPNTLYVEVAVVSADDRLMLMRKPVDAGGVYARQGRPWTCGVERSLNWERSDPGSGRIRIRDTVTDGLRPELGLSTEDVRSIEWCAVALEGHFNTALLGIVRLNRASTDFDGHTFPRMEHVEFVALPDVPGRVFGREYDGVWHTSARMRALLWLYRAYGSETAVNRAIAEARRGTARLGPRDHGLTAPKTA